MNLATMTPDKQVAYVLAHAAPGTMPELPPFLQVTEAIQKRRIEWNITHPIPPQHFMERVREQHEPKREVYVAPPPQPSKKKAKPAPLDMTGFFWDHRRGRYIPDGFIPPRKITAKITDEEVALAAAQRKLNDERAAKAPKKAKAAAPKPIVTGTTTPVPGKMGEKEKPIACLIRLLKRPEGVTLEEAASACGWGTPATAGARIGSDLKRKAGLLIDQTEEARGRVYRIAE